MKILVHDYAGHPFQIQLSRELARRGHEVIHAFATALQTPRGDLVKNPEDPAGLRIIPVEMNKNYSKHKYSFIRRRNYEVEYGQKMYNLIMEEKPEVVLSSNTPTETQQPIIQASLIVEARFWSWVQDFYSLAVDKIVNKKIPVVGPWVGSFYKWLERRQLAVSHGVVAITDDFKPIMVRDFGVSPDRVAVIPNWAPIESLPVRPKRNDWSEAHDLAEKFVFLYTGTLGMKHNPALLLELAKKHQADERVQVVVISEGLGADWLRDQVAAAGLKNLTLLPYQPFNQLPDVMAAGDVLIGVLEEDAGVFSVPSKILSYLCAQRPILLAAPEVNLATRTVATQRAGLTVPPNDMEAFLTAAGQLYMNPFLADKCANNARRYAEATFRITDIASRFEKLLTQPAAGTSPQGAAKVAPAAALAA